MVRGVSNDQFPTFDAESKSPKIPKSHYGRGVGIGQFSKVNFKFSKSSPELKFPFPGGRGGGGERLWQPIPVLNIL